MRIGFVIFLATAALMFHVYTEGKFLQLLFLHKKYLQLAGIAFCGLVAYYIFTNLSASRKFELYRLTNNYLSNTQVDGSDSGGGGGGADIGGGGGVLDNIGILDMTAENRFANDYNNSELPVIPIGFGAGAAAANGMPSSQRALTRMMNSGRNNNGKRSVSGAKKKFVASSQNWRCAACKNILVGFFEVDHVTRIADGGSNHISNLRALCIGCHRWKTAQETQQHESYASI